MLPSTATEIPKVSLAAPSDAVSSTCWLQLVPLCTNTYAAPAYVDEGVNFGPGDPTTTTPPLTATDRPKLSPVAPPEDVNSASWPQVVALCTNTYAAPWLAFEPPA